MAEGKYINKVDGQYNELAAEILRDGEWKENRTGIKTKSIFGRMLKFNLKDGFPLLTTRKLPIKSTWVELEGFIKGITSKKWYQDRGCHYWDYWASPEEINREFNFRCENGWISDYSIPNIVEDAKKEVAKDCDDLGPLGYSWGWRNFGESYNTDQYDNCDFYDYHNGVARGYDQLKNIVENIRKGNDNRRLVCSAWNPNQNDLAALYPCHYVWQANISNGKLNLYWVQRSVDIACGLPANISSYSTLAHLLAKEGNLEVGELTAFLGDTHIYENHIDQITEQITRPTFSLPKIEFEDYGDIFSWTYDKCKLVDYQAGEKIKYEVAV